MCFIYLPTYTSAEYLCGVHFQEWNCRVVGVYTLNMMIIEPNVCKRKLSWPVFPLIKNEWPLIHTLTCIFIAIVHIRWWMYIAQELAPSRHEHHLCSLPLSQELLGTPAHGSTARKPQPPRTFYFSGSRYIWSKPEAMLVHKHTRCPCVILHSTSMPGKMWAVYVSSLFTFKPDNYHGTC